MPRKTANSDVNTFNQTITIDGEVIKFNLTLIDKNRSMPIPLDNFISFIVEEDINSPFQKGVFKIKNDGNRHDTSKVPESITDKQLDFTLAETGENLLVLNLEFNTFTKTYIFYIIEESSEVNNGVKVKNFFVEDAALYKLKTNKIPFSTSNLLKGDTTQLSDAQRKVLVSDSIKNIIEDSLTKNLVNNEYWYKSLNKINYTSNFNESRLDSLDFLMDKALDLNNNFLLLLKRKNQFGLYSIQELYSDYMNLDFNNNFGGNFIMSNEEPITEKASTVVSYKANNYSIYNENSLDTMEKIINHKVVNYNFSKKTFNIFNEDNSVQSTIDNIKDNFLNTKTTIDRVESPSIKNNTVFNSLYSTTSDENTVRYEGRNTILKNLMNLSTMLSFSTQSVYNIEVGNFININYETQYNNKLTNKLNGGWFVTAFKHTLTQNSFNSDIVCTKFHELI